MFSDESGLGKTSSIRATLTGDHRAAACSNAQVFFRGGSWRKPQPLFARGFHFRQDLPLSGLQMEFPVEAGPPKSNRRGHNREFDSVNFFFRGRDDDRRVRFFLSLNLKTKFNSNV